MAINEQAALIRQVVRGEMNWRGLREHGIGIDVTPDAVRELTAIGEPVKVSAGDVASGWLRLVGQPRELREWARFVHGAVGLVELSLDEHPVGDALLAVLWATAFDEPLTREMEETVRRVMVSRG